MRLAVEKSVAACSVLVAHTRSILGIRFAVLSECIKEDLSIRLAVCNELRFHASLVWSPLATQATLRLRMAVSGYHGWWVSAFHALIV
jgi:hypothetical protein